MTRRRSDPDQRRRQQLAAIHIAAQQLQMDDGSYRDLLARVSAAHGTEARSAAALTPAQLQAVLDELRRLGAPLATQRTPRGRAKPGTYPGRPHNAGRSPLEITKIEAQLADMGLEWAYADAIAKRMYGIERVAWLRRPEQLVAILSALHVEQRKRASWARVLEECKRLGTDPDAVELALQLPAGWRRNRKRLVAVIEQLADMEAPCPSA